jgi:hypothetical protein
MRIWTSVVAVLALAAAGCASDTATPAGNTGPATAEMNRILDSLAAATGAERIGDVTWYDPENLHEHLKGLAASYVEAGLKALAHSEWRAKGGGAEYVDVDLYDMGSPLGALDVFADARAPASVYLPIGNECQRTAAGLEMRADRFFVRITARKAVSGQAELVKSLAEAVARAAGPGTPDATLISPLPSGKLLPHSARYRAHDYLGRDFLNDVRAAACDQYGTRVDMFVIRTSSPEDASLLMEHWRGLQPPPPIGTVVDSDRMAWDEPLIGSMIVARKGRWVVGVIGDPAAGRPVLDALVSRLD